MIRYNPIAIYTLGKRLAFIQSIDSEGRIDHQDAMRAFTASLHLQYLIDGGSITFSAATRSAGIGLAKILDACSDKWRDDVATFMAEIQSGKRQFGTGDVPFTVFGHLASEIVEKFREFETHFEGDCLELNLFHVPDVLAYRSTVLIEEATRLIPETLRPLMTPLIRSDIEDAGRCLALDAPTACAFHLGRCLEATMKEFHVTCVGPLPVNHQQQTMGALYVVWDKEPKVSRALVANVKNIKDNYRNPISHPELVVSIEEAHAMIGIYVAVITDMLIQIDKIKNPKSP